MLSIPLLQSYRNCQYYNQNPPLWTADYNQMLKYIITHEFGHSIGMLDEFIPNDKHLMYELIPRNCNGNGQFFFDPNLINDFSTSSKNQVIIKDQ